MFELGRELKRIFAADRLRSPQDGLTGGDSALLELLNADLLAQEAKAADIAAGRIGVKDRPRRRLEAAIVWREVARRTGDAVALRKAAACAETAAAGFEGAHRKDGWARARCEQAFCAMLGAEIFGDPGLNAAAAQAFQEARTQTRGGLAAPLADVGLLAIEGRQGLDRFDIAEVRAFLKRFGPPILALDNIAKRVTAARALAAEARLIRADLLCGWGVRLKDSDLLEAAASDAAEAADRLDQAFEPLTWARARIAHGQALALHGEVIGDVDVLAGGASALALTLEHLTRDHSPLDWARTQIALAQALQALGEASGEARAFEHAISGYDRANQVLKTLPVLPLRGFADSARSICLARSAELTGDGAVLDAAEAAMKISLAGMTPGRDPVAWALAQLQLARVYEARLGMAGANAETSAQRGAALIALDAALDVFGEHGLRSLSIEATDAIHRLRNPVES